MIWDKSVSLDVGATPRRSNSSLGDLIALTSGRGCSETMLAWNSTSSAI